MVYRTFAAIALVAIITGCGTGSTQQPMVEKPVETSLPYTYFQSKSETAGSNQNQMDLYVWGDAMNVDTLKMLCKEKKGQFQKGTFYFLAVFDSAESATFPTQPFTAAFGTDEEALRHIRALYTFNRLNGYSKLDYYEKNGWESVAQTVDI